MRRSVELLDLAVATIASAFAIPERHCIARPVAADATFRGALIRAESVDATRLKELRSAGYYTIVLVADDVALDSIATAATAVRAAELELGFWLEVARAPALADAHPDLMASLQGHEGWRRGRADAPVAKEDEVVKCAPWVPITTNEGAAAQIERVRALARKLPRARLWFVNDLQGGPSACGCGNLLCRWTSDYGDRRTTTPAGDEAAARFVSGLRRELNEAAKSSSSASGAPASDPAISPVQVIPVWTSECEAEDRADKCSGVACFGGACWRALWNQLTPVARENDLLGLQLLSRTFERVEPASSDPPTTARAADARDAGAAAWITKTFAAFAAEDPRRQGPAIPAARFIAVLEAAGRSDAAVNAELAAVQAAGARGVLVAFAPIEQGFTPKVVKLAK